MAVHAHHMSAPAFAPRRLPGVAIGVFALGHPVGGGKGHERDEHDPERRADRGRAIEQAHRSDADGGRQEQLSNPDVELHGNVYGQARCQETVRNPDAYLARPAGLGPPLKMGADYRTSVGPHLGAHGGGSRALQEPVGETRLER